MFGVFFRVVCGLLVFASAYAAEDKHSSSQTSDHADVSDNRGVEGENLKGHLRPFGESGPRLQIEERSEFPEPTDFLMNYVKRSKPLKLSGVARTSRAVRLWSDDYLLGLDVPADTVVQLETRKKEDRNQEGAEMHFHQFLRVYNQTEYYMVDDVPAYLSPDVMVPCSLQWKEMIKGGFSLVLMWFSSGGTKSVIHTDSFDNINCLIRGEKTFVMVDPDKHREKIHLRYIGAYSDIDVDSVDLNLYPSLADMEFYHVNMSAGDCLFIPYRWIHQVRSHHSNVAVNFWWDHYRAVSVLDSGADSVCGGPCDPDLTLDQIMTKGDGMVDTHFTTRDSIREFLYNHPEGASAQDLLKVFKDMHDLSKSDAVLKCFEKMDLNNDGLLTAEEHGHIPEEIWREVHEEFPDLVDEDQEEMDIPRDEL